MRLIRCLLLIPLVTAIDLFLVWPASAACVITYTPVVTDGAVVMQAHEDCSGNTTAGVDVPVDLPPTDSGLDSICVQTAITVGADPFDFCDIPPDQAPGVTPAMVAAAMARIPLPAAQLQIQPANGRTLVNFDTNFYTEIQPLDRTITMLGQQIDLHVVPSRFGWRFGDGEALTTDQPGAPYPHLDVTHSYLRKGAVAPSVDTTYTAQFSVNGGPWRDVPGSVTIAGEPVELEVLTATPTLVGY